jgi:pantoate--beta-alanine ligase
MILFKNSGDLTRWLHQQKAFGNSIGFVPTLGALHEGHISLITISKRTTQVTVCSIFVNPTQFNDPKDFQKYPVTLEKDIALLEGAGADILFLPEVGEMYPDGTKNLETYDLGYLETILEGKYRPGHFQGVCQVMQRLLRLVKPDHLFMGQKDYQQCLVVQKLIDLIGWKIRFHRCPIVREPDGLAMSSRNVRLNPEERQRSTAIYRALHYLSDAKDITAALPNARKILEEAQFRIDYVAIADAKTLQPLEPAHKEPGSPAPGSPAPNSAGAVALIAAFQGEVRLIDNMILDNMIL